jgi:hypothetical protein
MDEYLINVSHSTRKSRFLGLRLGTAALGVIAAHCRRTPIQWEMQFPLRGQGFH